MDTYGWFMLRFVRKQQNFVKQLSFNKKLIKKKIAGRNINNFRYVDDTTLMAESEETLKSLLLKMKASAKASLKLNIRETKIMASSPITS